MTISAKKPAGTGPESHGEPDAIEWKGERKEINVNDLLIIWSFLQESVLSYSPWSTLKFQGNTSKKRSSYTALSIAVKTDYSIILPLNLYTISLFPWKNAEKSSVLSRNLVNCCFFNSLQLHTDNLKLGRYLQHQFRRISITQG